MKALDLGCGAGGASLGLHAAGYTVVGVDHDRDACATHAAAGWPTIRADLTRPLPLHDLDDLAGVWASPPCTAFSMAGKGEGRDLSGLLIERLLAEDWAPWEADPSVWLYLPTVATIIDLHPERVWMENVQPTRPVMDAAAQVLERHGYRTRVWVLHAEMFGVPQTRTRCFLAASHVGPVNAPDPTHQKYRHGEPATVDEGSLFGALAPWVSMAEALGWDEGPVLDRRAQNADGSPVPPVPVTSPSPSLTVSGLGGQFVWRSDPMDNACIRSLDEPAGTVKMGHEPPRWVGADSVQVTVAEAATLQGFPPDHPWQGSKSSTFRQIGNAVPPALAEAVVRATP